MMKKNKYLPKLEIITSKTNGISEGHQSTLYTLIIILKHSQIRIYQETATAKNNKHLQIKFSTAPYSFNKILPYLQI